MNGPPPLRRILVALDQSAPSLGALETAAHLAAENDAELVGLFIEERHLHTLAALPVTRLVGAAGASQLDPALMRRALKVQAARARDALSRTAEARQIAWSFRIVEGDADAVLVEEARQCDLLALGRCSGGSDPLVRLGRTARQASRQCACSLLLTPPPALERRPLLALYDGDERVLATAAALARRQARPLEVAVVDDGRDTVEERLQSCRRWCEDHDLAAVPIRRLAPGALRALLQADEVGMLVATRAGPSLSAAERENLLETLSIPILLLGEVS